jgi:hypothetical protein
VTITPIIFTNNSLTDLIVEVNLALVTVLDKYIREAKFFCTRLASSNAPEYGISMVLEDSVHIASEPFQWTVLEGKTALDVENWTNSFIAANPGYFIAPTQYVTFESTRKSKRLIAGILYNTDFLSGTLNFVPFATDTTGPGTIAIKDEGVQIIASASAINFIGDGVTATDAGGGVADVTIPGGAGHARLHAMQSTSDHSSTTITGQILKADANGLPTAASNTDAQVSAAVSAAHAKAHAITSATDHTSSATPGQMLKADANGLPVDASNTDTQVSAAVSASHAKAHNIASATDHTSSIAQNQILKADANGLPSAASNTDAQVSAAVTNAPSTTQKAALAGTHGTPSDTNRFVTQSDPLLGASLAVEDEGILVLAAASALNFVGAGVTVTDEGSDVARITIPGGGGSGNSYFPSGW